MAKKQTFIDKSHKIKVYSENITCPSCKKEAHVNFGKMVESKISEKTGSWKFVERKVKLCSECGFLVQ
jgi:NMD protein affecting ribosome stability and mRNA decay